MTRLIRYAGLPAVSLALVSGVLAVQLAHGGGTFEPLQTADPCAARPVTSTSEGIDGLTEELVLIAIDDAACALGESREALTLELARGDSATDAQVDALRDGLLSAVRQLDEEGALPPASALVDEALDNADLNGLLEAAIRALPASVIDAALKTDDVLTRAIEDLDVRALLADLDDRGAIDRQLQAAIDQAVRDSLAARLRDLVPGL